MTGKDRLDKVLAVAINPGAYEGEAVAALHKARELVRRDPNLAFDLPSMSCPSLWLNPADEVSFEVEINGVSEFWLPIVLNTLSEQASALRSIFRLRSAAFARARDLPGSGIADSRIFGESELVALQLIWRSASAAARKRTGSRSPTVAAAIIRLATISRTTSGSPVSWSTSQAASKASLIAVTASGSNAPGTMNERVAMGTASPTGSTSVPSP
jgi:hypothetical protein